MSPSHVLCPIDGTAHSAKALADAAFCAATIGVPLHVFSAVEDPHEIAARRAAIDFQVASNSPNPEVVVDITVTAAPHAPQAIVAFAGSDAQVVMATTTRQHLLTGYLGSATEHVVRNLHRPVLSVGPHTTVGLGDVMGVVVPCDGSELSEAAVPVGREWADRLGVELTVVSVLEAGASGESGETNYVRNTAKAVDAQWEVLHDVNPAVAITDFARDRLVVMTTHGRSGVSRFRLGSVAVETTRLASAPVIILDPAATSAMSLTC